MAQLTWRNVDAPNFSGVAAGYRAFSDLISNAGKTASDAIGTYDDTTRMDAANPGIQAYFQAAAQGNPNAAKDALAQHSAAFGNLRPDQLGKVFSDGSGITKTNLGNQADYFRSMVAQRDDGDKQSAVEAANRIGKMIGVNSDLPRILGQDVGYNQLTPAAQQMTQNILAGNGWQKPYSPGAQGSGSPGVPSLGSGNPAAAAIGSAMGTGTSRADRNANPGNLKAPTGTWVRSAPGFLGVDDGGFAKFDTPANGLAAMATQLNRYREGTQATGGKPVKTVEGIIGTWSPTSDPLNAPGSTNNYAKYVAGKLGLNPGDEVPADKMSAMAQAMYEFESGNRGKAAISTTDPANAWRSKLDTPGELGAASGAAKVDMAMAKSMRNLTGISNIMAKGGDLTNPSDVADALVGKWKTIPHPVMMEEISRIVRDHEVTPAQAGEILLNQGMGSAGGWWSRLGKAITNSPFGGTGYEPNEERIASRAAAIKTPQAQQKVAENDDLARADASLTAAQEKFTAENDVLKQLRIRAVDNPELAGSVLAAEGRAAAAMKKWQNLVKLQNVTKEQRQEFPENDGNMPPAVREALGLPPDPNKPVNTGEGNYGAGPAALAGIANVMIGRSLNGKATPAKQPVAAPSKPQADPRDNWKNLSSFFGSSR